MLKLICTKQVEFVLDKSFSPNTFKKINIPFQTRQQSYEGFTASVKISVGKDTHTIPYKLSFRPGVNSRVIDLPLGQTISHENTLVSRSQRKRPLSDRNFGIELELTMSNRFDLNDVRATLQQAGLQCEVHHQSQAKNVKSFNWKIVHDGSILCRPGDEGCIRFELVSPILSGGEGLQEIHTLLEALSTLEGIDVNKSAGNKQQQNQLSMSSF
jgi:hypothetical protein